MTKNLPKKFVVAKLKDSSVTSNFDFLHDKISAHKTTAYSSLNSKFNKFQNQTAREAGVKLLGSGVLAAAALIGPFNLPQLPSPADFFARTFAVSQTSPHNQEVGLAVLLDSGLKQILPKDTYLLSYKRKQLVSDWVSQVYGIKATSELEGHALPADYGLIGAEQHLLRYPGDTTEAHMRDPEDWPMYYASGTAPLTGAWGYFASSLANLTPDLAQKERYYAVVQTFLLPDWNQNWSSLKEWYKYRKVIIVNTETYQACVADIADSGPSPWTGKVFGGSPEVMEVVGLAHGMRKGPVVILFVDDPENKVPLGPIPYADTAKYV